MRGILLVMCLLMCLSTATAQHPSTQSSSLLLFGAFTYTGVWSGDAAIVELEGMLGRELDIIHWYMGWNNDWDHNLVASVSSERRLPMISWQSVGIPLSAIAGGQHDSYIRSWADGVREFGRLVYLRPFPEMNGNWNDWHGQPELLIQAWRRIAGIFESAGADNVRWVWSPNVTDEPRTEENRMENYFPGPEYVDILALDGFNWGTVRPALGWQTAEEIFAGGYARIARLANRPIWFAEIGSTDQGGDKAQWINELLRNSWQWFPRLTAIIWFDENKEADWRIASSVASVNAFRLLP